MTLLKQRRETSGMTQYTLSTILLVQQTSISRWESGRVYPIAVYRRAIARALGGTADDYARPKPAKL